MPNIIKLLPDSVANQIAAGEVIQRPSSVVKELLENSLDAGGSKVQLVIEDAGKKLISVIDDGKGMSEMDARMALERHATSKIRTAADLEKLVSFGFRGEALASIASIAQVEIKTRQEEDEMGSMVKVSSGKIDDQKYCAAPRGTRISVKNLFYNVPARRKFLKSDTVELKHILDEFYHVALPNPEVEFQLESNGKTKFHLKSSSLKQRIIKLLGKSYEGNLIPINEQTGEVKISGFVGAPELSRAKRGNQFFFLNGRYFVHNYFRYAVKQAFGQLIPDNHHPFFVIMIDMEPSLFDVNVHPTKQEVRFENEKIIFDLLKAATRYSLGQYSLHPSLDFDSNTARVMGGSDIPVSNNYDSKGLFAPQSTGVSKQESKAWKDFYDQVRLSDTGDIAAQTETQVEQATIYAADSHDVFATTLAKKWVVATKKDEMILVHKLRALHKILYEKYRVSESTDQPVGSQPLLFPKTIDLSPINHEVVLQQIDTLNQIGFEISDFGNNSILVHAVPADIDGESGLKELIESYAESEIEPKDAEMPTSVRAKTLRLISYYAARQKLMTSDRVLDPRELVTQLMSLPEPHICPDGKLTFVIFDEQKIQSLF